MHPDVIRELNAINQRFYEITAAEFDQTRGAPWQGWEPLLPHLPQGSGGESLSVLDVGCGNGRFGVFLANQVERSIAYHGLDTSESLMAQARVVLDEAGGLTATLEHRDAIESPPEQGAYDLVVAFGVLHHVPGYEHRRIWLRALAERVNPGGVLVFTAWRFYEYERFRERILPWPPELADRVEQHDYLLDWRRGETAVRYCHYVDDTEHNALVEATGLPEIQTYRADGFTGAVNRYSVLRRPADSPR